LQHFKGYAARDEFIGDFTDDRFEGIGGDKLVRRHRRTSQKLSYIPLLWQKISWRQIVNSGAVLEDPGIKTE
jgi:hypothetical protein